MNLFKKLLSVILASVMIISCVLSTGTLAFAGEGVEQQEGDYDTDTLDSNIEQSDDYDCDFNTGDASWTVDPVTKSIVISGTGSLETNDAVTSNLSTIKTITVNEGITSIGTVFAGSTELKTISLPSTVTAIDDGAFNNCTSLNCVNIANGTTTIGDNAFKGCTSLSEIYIPSCVTTISPTAFANCSSTISICGVKGSYCEAYAKSCGINFIDINNRCLDISKMSVTVSKTSYTYTGSAIKPTVSIKYGTDTLVSGTDFAVSYSSNINPGIATITVTGSGKYTGTVKKTFNINPKAISGLKVTPSTTSVKLTWTKSVGATGYQIYDSKLKKTYTSTTNSLTIKSLKAGSLHNYKIRAYKTVGSTNLYSSYSAYVNSATKPSATSISKLSTKAKKITVKWAKKTNATGYQVQYSTSSKFKSAKTVTVSKNSTTSKTINKLKKGKKYYIRVRTYKTYKSASGKSVKVYSSWSKSKAIKCK